MNKHELEKSESRQITIIVTNCIWKRIIIVITSCAMLSLADGRSLKIMINRAKTVKSIHKKHGRSNFLVSART